VKVLYLRFSLGRLREMDCASSVAGLHFITEFDQRLVKSVLGCVDVGFIAFYFKITRDLWGAESIG